MPQKKVKDFKAWRSILLLILSGLILNVFNYIIKVDFQLQSEEGDTGTFIANGEWALLGM